MQALEKALLSFHTPKMVCPAFNNCLPPLRPSPTYSHCFHRPQALEKALLSFHTSKMADINKTVKELWQKTYRNQDIDYIQVGCR